MGQDSDIFTTEVQRTGVHPSKKPLVSGMKKPVYHMKINFTSMVRRVTSKEQKSLSPNQNESNRSAEKGFESNRSELKSVQKFNFQMASTKRNYTQNSPSILKKKTFQLSKFSSEKTESDPKANPNSKNKYVHKKYVMRNNRQNNKIKSQDFQNRSEDPKNKYMIHNQNKTPPKSMKKPPNTVKAKGSDLNKKTSHFDFYKRSKKLMKEGIRKEGGSTERRKADVRGPGKFAKKKLYLRGHLKEKIKREKLSLSPQTSAENQFMFKKRLKFQQIVISEEMIKVNQKSKIINPKFKNPLRVSRESKLKKKLIKSGSGSSTNNYNLKSFSNQTIKNLKETTSLPKKRLLDGHPRLRRNLFNRKPSNIKVFKSKPTIENESAVENPHIMNLSLEQNFKQAKMLSQPKRRSDYMNGKFGSRKKKNPPVNNIKMNPPSKIKREIFGKKPKFAFRKKFHGKSSQFQKPRSFDPNLKGNSGKRVFKGRLFPNGIRSRQIKSASNPLKPKLHSKINLSREKKIIISKLTKKIDLKRYKIPKKIRMSKKNATPNPKTAIKSDGWHLTNSEKNNASNLYSQVQNKPEARVRREETGKLSREAKGVIKHEDQDAEMDDLMCHETELEPENQICISQNVELSFRNNYIDGKSSNLASKWADPKLPMKRRDPVILGASHGKRIGINKNKNRIYQRKRKSQRDPVNLFEDQKNTFQNFSQSPSNLKNVESSLGENVNPTLKLKFKVAPNMKRGSKLYKNKKTKHAYRKSSNDLSNSGCCFQNYDYMSNLLLKYFVL